MIIEPITVAAIATIIIAIALVSKRYSSGNQFLFKISNSPFKNGQLIMPVITI